MKRASKVLYLSFGGVLIIIFGLLLAGLFEAYREQHEAKRFLEVLRQIDIGADAAGTLKRLEPFRSYTSLSQIDDRGESDLNFTFDNLFLSMLKVAPYTDFSGWITFKNGVVVKKSARVFVAQSGSSGHVTEQKRGFGFADGYAPSDYPNHIVHAPPKGYSGPAKIFIDDDDSYPRAQRLADWDLNLSCLTTLRQGCSDARRILPNAVATPNAID